MTTDNRNVQLGTLVDATGAKRGFQEVKDAAKDMATSVQQSGQQAGKGIDAIGDGAGKMVQSVDRATRNMETLLQRTIAAEQTRGQDVASRLEALGKLRGADPEYLKPLYSQLREVVSTTKAANDALATSPAALEKVGISAKQTAAALRGVPAQFTDIAVGLAGGQNPLTVLLQQGGQLKDMFGGIGPAARALGGYVAGLVNPFTVTAAAASILATAFIQGSEEATALQKSLILTGGAAGVTSGQLQDMARAIGATTSSVTQGAASAALAKLVETGAVAGSNLQKYAAAAVEFEQATGTSIDKTADRFKELGKAPLDASVKLNEQIHYLTLSSYEHIKALSDQGRAVDAARAAQDAYADAIAERSKQIAGNMGFMETAVKGVTTAWKLMWDAALGAGRSETGSEQLAGLKKQLEDLEKGGAKALLPAQRTIVTPQDQAAYDKLVASVKTEIEFLERGNALLVKQAESAKKAADQVAARAAWDKEGEKYLNQKEQRERAIAKVRAEGLAAGASELDIQQRIAAVAEKFKDAKSPSVHDDEGTRMLQQAKERLAVLQAQGSATEKMTAAEQELVRFEQLIASLQGKKLTDGQKTILAMQDQIRAVDQQAAAISRANADKEKQAQLDKEAQQRAESLAKSIDAINISMESSQQARSAQYDRELSAFGLGDRYRQNLEAEKAIREEYRRQQVQLDKKADTPELRDSDAYKKETQQIKDSLDAALASRRQYYEADAEARKQWENGASRSLANFLDRASDVSSQTEQLFTRAFDGITDVFTQFIMTGKGGFEDLARSVIATLVRIQAQAILTGNGAAGGGLIGAIGRAFGLPGKGAAPATSVADFSVMDFVMPSALGNIYDRAGLLQSANGNIFDRATLHGYGNGKLGVLGEAGPEAVMPLKRGRDGRLGLAGGGGTTTINNIYQTVGDVASMKEVRQTVNQALGAAQVARARSIAYGGDESL